MDGGGSAEAGYAGRLVPGALAFAYAEGLVVTTRNTVVKRVGGTVLVYEPVRLIRGRAH